MGGVTAADLEALRAELSLEEGVKLFPYDDATGKRLQRGDTIRGNITIGRGRNLSQVGLSMEEVDHMSDNDISGAIGAINKRWGWFPTLDSVRQRVLIDIAFNAGIEGLSKFPLMLEACRLGDYEAAGQEIINSQIAPARKQRLAKMMETGTV